MINTLSSIFSIQEEFSYSGLILIQTLTNSSLSIVLFSVMSIIIININKNQSFTFITMNNIN